jgi:hypothetical protein
MAKKNSKISQKKAPAKSNTAKKTTLAKTPTNTTAKIPNEATTKKKPANVIQIGKLKLSPICEPEKNEEYAAFLKERQSEFATGKFLNYFLFPYSSNNSSLLYMTPAVENITEAKRKKIPGCGQGEDLLYVFKWNAQGLLDRVATAAALGWTNNAGAVVTTANDMIEHFARSLTTGPNAGIDLGSHHDIFQFIPSHRATACLQAFVSGNLFLRHCGLGATPVIAGADAWRDIVDYFQEIQIVKSNAAVGPVDCPIVFNC